jgi:hypothetical protein
MVPTTGPDSRDLIIVQAGEQDVRELFELLYVPPKDNLRARSESFIAHLVEQGACYKILGAASDQVVGTCYVAEPDAGSSDFEFGGAYIMEQFRGAGLFPLIALTSIVHWYLWRASEEPHIGLIAHVVRSNRGPRSGLESLGFTLEGQDYVDPRLVPGFDHMPHEADGRVIGDRFRWPLERKCELVRELLGVVRDGLFRSRPSPARIQLPGLTTENLQEALDRGGC